MRLSQIDRTINRCADAKDGHGNPRPISVEIISAPGRGKSTKVRQITIDNSARDGFEWGFAVCFLATMTPSDLMGFLMPQKMPDGTLRSVFAQPSWMTTVDGRQLSEFQRGILLLDEYGQGESDVKRASAELLLNGGIGQHKIPPGWVVIAASNRSTDRSGVTKQFDFVINRRMEVHVTDDLEAWEQWADENMLRPEVRVFGAQNAGILFTEGVPDKQGPWCTPRSLEMVSNLFVGSLAPGEPIPEDEGTLEEVAGLIGSSAASTFFATVKLANNMPSYSAIVADPKGTTVPTRLDAQMLVSHTLAARVNAADAPAVITYMERFPKEWGVTFAKQAARRDQSLINTKAFGDWCVKNASIMAAIADRKS